MSTSDRSHRDDAELVGRDAPDPAPIHVPPPAPVIGNAEAERAAKAQRRAAGQKDEEAPESETEKLFSGDLPPPKSRADGDETETRTVAGVADVDDESVLAMHEAWAAMRGPPPPRARESHDESTWAKPPQLDSLAIGVTDGGSWARRPGFDDESLLPLVDDDSPWARR